MLIHEHSERVGATTEQVSGASSTATIQPQRPERINVTAPELVVMAVGWLLLGMLLGWAMKRGRVRGLRAERDRYAKRWLRASERCELAKEVIARMVAQESEGRRERDSAVA